MLASDFGGPRIKVGIDPFPKLPTKSAPHKTASPGRFLPSASALEKAGGLNPEPGGGPVPGSGAGPNPRLARRLLQQRIAASIPFQAIKQPLDGRFHLGDPGVQLRLAAATALMLAPHEPPDLRRELRRKGGVYQAPAQAGKHPRLFRHSPLRTMLDLLITRMGRAAPALMAPGVAFILPSHAQSA